MYWFDKQHGLQGELGPTIAQLRHGYMQIVEGIGDPVGVAQGIIAPEIRRLEKLLTRSNPTIDPEDPKPREKITIRHVELVQIIRERFPQYEPNHLSVSFQVNRLTAGARGGAIINVEVEAHG